MMEDATYFCSFLVPTATSPACSYAYAAAALYDQTAIAIPSVNYHHFARTIDHDARGGARSTDATMDTPSSTWEEGSQSDYADLDDDNGMELRPIQVGLPRHRREEDDDASDVSSECSGEPGSPYGSPYPRWPVCKLAARMPQPPLLQRLGTAPRIAGGMRDRKAGYSADEGEVLEAPARGGHVRGRQGGLHRRRHLQRDHQPLRDRLRELPQAGAAAGGEEVHVAAGDGLPALRLRLHRRVLPVQGGPARRHRPRGHGDQAQTRHLRQPPRPREARRHAARDPGRVSEDRILVPERQGAQGQQRRLGALPSGEPPGRGEVVAARAVRHQARPRRVGPEGPAAEARLREPDPQGRHGHQQRHSRGDQDSRVVHADTSQVRAGERGRRDLPAHVVPGQVRAGVPAGLPGDLVGARGPGGRRPRGGGDARVAAEGQPRPLEVPLERRQGPHGVGQERDAGQQGTGRPALPQAALPRPLPDHPRRQQDTAQQGRWASHPGELLQGAGEPGIYHSNMYRRRSFRRRVRDEDLMIICSSCLDQKPK